MSRGYIYHMTPDPADVGSMTASTFDDMLDSMPADYASDCSDPEVIGSFMKRLKSAGFAVEPLDGDGPGQGYVLKAMPEDALLKAKASFFAPRLKELKSVVAGLSEDAFATDGDELLAIQRAVNDQYGDAVYLGCSFGASFKTLDTAVRQLMPDTDYFVAPGTVLMH